MSTRTDRDAPPVHRRLWAAKTLRDGHVLYWWLEMLAIGLFYIVYSAIRNADKARAHEALGEVEGGRSAVREAKRILVAIGLDDGAIVADERPAAAATLPSAGIER